ncbi:MAG TPA: hypothetical protein V6D28_09890 [Leptolyngbyaceae cyanobacterium]
MKNYRFVLWLNGLSLLLVLLLVVYAKLFSPSVSLLFFPPPSPIFPELRLLTYAFQLLCAVPAIVCAFSFGLLKTINPLHKKNIFILASALLTGAFLMNEIYRFHIILTVYGISKIVTSLVYGIVTLIYAVMFWRIIKSTPYFLLLTGISLLFAAIVVDSLNLHGDGVPSVLEGVPKLFSEINIALYYWYVCHQEIIKEAYHYKSEKIE